MREQRGAMLMELLISIPAMLIVLLAIVNMYATTVTSQVRVQSRGRATIDAQNGLDRMTRELRQANAIDAQSSQVVDAWMPDRNWVRYDCSKISPGDSGKPACERLQRGAGGVYPSSGPVLVDDVVNSGIFSYQPDPVNPTYISVTLQVRLRDKRGNLFGSPIQINDGAELRNMSFDS